MKKTKTTTTEETTYTPGPWEVVLNDDDVSCMVTFEIRMGSRLSGRNGWETHHRIDYEIPAQGESPEQFAEAEANAHLIAAAPDLFEAAKRAAMEWRLHGQLTDSCRVLEAAIAKATGEAR